jgi:hypothetical protein
MIFNCAIGLGALGLIGWRRKKKARSVDEKSWLVLYL